MSPTLAVFLRIVLTAIGLLVTVLPRPLELFFGRYLGLFLLALGGTRARVARDNLKKCFSALSDDERESLLRENYKHYGILAMELLHLFSPVPGHYRNYTKRVTKLTGYENWKRAHDKGKGVIFVSAHLGNWELMVGAGALAGMPLTMVTKKLKPQWLHDQIEQSRKSVGVSGAYEPRTLPIVMRALRNGESVGFVMDQYAGPPIGIPVPFFGVKVGTLAAVSVLVERTGAAVVPVRAYRDAMGVVCVDVQPEIDLSAISSDNEACTAALTNRVELWVRELPTQWLWIHRRFKNVVWPNEKA
jgi:KDO2-lipid IV(A) lauroyltransferase